MRHRHVGYTAGARRRHTCRASPAPSTRIVYGSTEAGPGTALAHHDLDAKAGKRGAAEPGVEVRIAENGEVCLRSDFLMSGYFEEADATAAALLDGWYHTGDMGALDDEGYLSSSDGVRDVIRTGGETVSPVEVEGALADHPAVAEVAVVGVPDSAWGEVVAAVVVATPGPTSTSRPFGPTATVVWRPTSTLAAWRSSPPCPALRRPARSSATSWWKGSRCRNSILPVQNAVPAERAMRTLTPRYETYTAEVRRLLDAGFEVMRRTGNVNPRVSEIVRDAGLSNQAFYRHFASKDELLVAFSRTACAVWSTTSGTACQKRPHRSTKPANGWPASSLRRPIARPPPLPGLRSRRPAASRPVPRTR